MKRVRILFDFSNCCEESTHIAKAILVESLHYRNTKMKQQIQWEL